MEICYICIEKKNLIHYGCKCKNGNGISCKECAQDYILYFDTKCSVCKHPIKRKTTITNFEKNLVFFRAIFLQLISIIFLILYYIFLIIFIYIFLWRIDVPELFKPFITIYIISLINVILTFVNNLESRELILSNLNINLILRLIIITPFKTWYYLIQKWYKEICLTYEKLVLLEYTEIGRPLKGIGRKKK